MSNLESKKIRMPEFIHEAFGEWQTWKSLLAIAVAVAVVGVIWLPSIWGLSVWRQVIAGVLILDIAAGAVANFSQGTNDYYKARPKNRWWFIALHLHLPLVGLLLGETLWPYLIAWAYTIGAAVIVNLSHSRSNQVFIGGVLICLGIIGIVALPLSSLGMMVSLLFLFKVAFSFAVNHYD